MEGVDLTADPENPMRRAVARYQPSADTEKPPRLVDLETAWDNVLLDRIHGFYLEAISRIPPQLLRSRHHRGLVKAGHCYGPFDPVTNIILNTIWYDTAFPAKKKFQVDMIGDESLARAESNSLNGLMAFVATLFPELPSFDVTRYLLFDNARLDRVISSVMRDGYNTSVSLSDAYNAAARTAGHPNPAGLAKLATEIMPVVEGELKSLIEAKRTLSPNDVGIISKSLSQHYPPSKPVEVVQKLTRGAAKIVSARREEFEAHRQSVRERVEASLRKHALEKHEEYELLVICGVNAEVPKDGNFGYFDNMDGYPYSHINIWARLKGPQLADAAPTPLFIQCSNDTEDTNDIPFMCLPVPGSSNFAGRCFHCEHHGNKIVHPSSSQTYLGQTFDFEEMARGDLDRLGALKTVFMGTSEEDCIYFDPAWDADFAVRLNRVVKREDAASVRAKRAELKEVAREMAAYMYGSK